MRQEPNTLEGVAANGPGDLRLFDEHGAELPYLLVDPPSPRETGIGGRPRPTVPGRTTTGFEVDLAASVTVDRLRVEGLPAGFQKRVRLDASGDRARWTRLVDEGSLFDLPDQGLSQLELWFEPGQFRYLRLTWDDRNSGRLPLPRSASVRQAILGVDAFMDMARTSVNLLGNCLA